MIENALNATGDGDRIVLEATARGTTATLAVVDTGEGIPPEQAERVFDRFARLPHADGSRARGTGLGLPIVKAVVDAHGGTVRLDSDPGRGTRVELRLTGFVPERPPEPVRSVERAAP